MLNKLGASQANAGSWGSPPSAAPAAAAAQRLQPLRVVACTSAMGAGNARYCQSWIMRASPICRLTEMRRTTSWIIVWVTLERRK